LEKIDFEKLEFGEDLPLPEDGNVE